MKGEVKGTTCKISVPCSVVAEIATNIVLKCSVSRTSVLSMSLGERKSSKSDVANDICFLRLVAASAKAFSVYELVNVFKSSSTLAAID
jgi:hypothetical protein